MVLNGGLENVAGVGEITYLGENITYMPLNVARPAKLVSGKRT